MLPSLDIARGLGIVKDLFVETQPNSLESKLPLDLNISVYILSTVLSLLNSNLKQGAITDVQKTVVSLLNVLFRISFIYLHP